MVAIGVVGCSMEIPPDLAYRTTAVVLSYKWEMWCLSDAIDFLLSIECKVYQAS
ncbi:hypothetical protein PR003_g24193 [Phytophthora rubi]|uniref:Uncharacterized protein n=1 Tax=Phytophthora rubi TaxID=129364 RepID=A0A6A3IAI7_9STRA|nr:hypothetical protein PR002_g26324 [Phytophthora rubi]KAE8979170.1 hypothetical protein PR001_g24630 [Phytophthora rubi]KAE9294717.1 hypothetical protein PR003_g24193 [Phytophthora rubi]